MSLEKTHCIIEIDSADRTKGEINDFEIVLKHPVYLNRDRQYFVRFEGIRLPTSFYNIDKNYNTLKITEDPSGSPSTWSITIDEGNYTINELLVDLKDKLESTSISSGKSNVYTLTISDKTGKITITTNTTEFKIVGSDSSLNNPLGFEENTDYTSISKSLISPNHIVMNTKRYLKINSDISSNNHYSRDLIEPIGCIVPITEARSTIQYYSNSTGYKSKMDNRHNIKHIGVYVRDSNNKKVNFNGVNWNCELVIYEWRQ